MSKTAYVLLAVSIVTFTLPMDAYAIGGRGGGGARGGGISRGGGGGYRGGGVSRPAPSRSPSVSRPSPSRPSPSTRPNTGSRPNAGTRPNAGARPNTGARPNAGTRPGVGSRPTSGQLNNFLDIPKTGSPGSRPNVGGGAAADFLNNPKASQRPGTRPGERPGRLPGIDPVRRPGDGLGGNRPDRIDNRGERSEQRLDRRNEARSQFLDHHPRYDFWSDHPDWARFRLNRPYRWATWGLVTGWFPGVWSEPASYNYGENIYYEDNSVYYGDEVVASSEEYAEQAQTLAASAPEEDEAADWMSLGVFAVTQDGEDSGPPPTLFLQLAVNKQGIIAGTFENMTTEKSQPVEGMVDMKSQRSAWAITGKEWPIMETGLSNLTKDTAAALLHFEDGQTQQWLLIRMEDPKGETQ